MDRGDFKITSIEILKGCNPLYVKNLKKRKYRFTGEVPSEFFGRNISVSVIVGKNGAGKSSLLELMFRMINNFNFCLNSQRQSPKNLEPICFITGLHCKLNYTLDGKEYSLKCDGNVVELEGGEEQYLMSPFPQDGIKGYVSTWGCKMPEAIKLASQFFYTIVMNSSLHAYNSREFADEPAYEFYDTKSDEFMGRGNWMHSMFNRTDGYFSAIALNPYRKDGVIDINTETELTMNRLVALLLFLKVRNRELVAGYDLESVEYEFDPTSLWEKLSSIDYIKERHATFDDMLRAFYSAYNAGSISSIILRAYDIPINLDQNVSYHVACIYLVYKTISVAKTYAAYSEFNKSISLDMMFEEYHGGDENVELLVTTIMKDKSHITAKIRRTLAYLRNDFDKPERYIFELLREYLPARIDRDLSKMSLEGLMNLLPPPFFKPTIMLKRVEDEKVIGFNKMSSGERQLAFMMATIVYQVVNVKSVPSSRLHYRCFNLVLDEVELCFHPEYQRTFLNELLGVIKRLHLNTHCKFNILLTTHSPFLLSDIPLDNIVFLSDGDDVTEKQRNPFAGNVNDILYNSFFLESGFMGEWVKRRILSLIDFLKSGKNKKDWSEVDARKFITMVGDEFLRSQLLALFELNPNENEKNMH